MIEIFIGSIRVTLEKLKLLMRNITVIFISSALGIFSIIIPIFINERVEHYDSPLFPILRTGIEGFSSYSLLFLFISGFIVKLYSKMNFAIIGLSIMLAFPTASIIEIFYDRTSHNMLPFEFIFYLFLTVPPIIGAFFGLVARKGYERYKM